MNMGKEKIEEKDVRLLRYAVEQAFDGAMRDGALALLNRLVDSASEAANLEEELLNLKGEYQRSMENSKREGHSNALMLPTSANAGERSEWRRGRCFAQTASRSCSVRPFTEGTDAIG